MTDQSSSCKILESKALSKLPAGKAIIRGQYFGPRNIFMFVFLLFPKLIFSPSFLLIYTDLSLLYSSSIFLPCLFCKYFILLPSIYYILSFFLFCRAFFAIIYPFAFHLIRHSFRHISFRCIYAIFQIFSLQQMASENR
jgi:hypothetical protein